MGCLNATVKSLHMPFVIKVSRLNGHLAAKVSLSDEHLTSKVSLFNKHLVVNTFSYSGLHPKVDCSLICSISPIIVIPEDIQWVSVDIYATYKIITEKSWIIN